MFYVFLMNKKVAFFFSFSFIAGLRTVPKLGLCILILRKTLCTMVSFLPGGVLSTKGPTGMRC